MRSATKPAASKASVDSKWFKDKIRDSGMSMRKIASLMDLNHAALSLTLSGKRRAQIHEAATLATLLGVPLDDVLARLGIDVKKGVAGTLPIMGWVDEAYEVHMDGRDRGRVESPPGLPEHSVAVRIENPASLLDGAVVIYAPRADVKSDALSRFCIVKTEQGATLYRHVRKGYTAGRYNLVTLGTPQIEDVPLVSASPVLWIKF